MSHPLRPLDADTEVRALALLEAALELPPAARARFVIERTEGSPAVEARAHQLLGLDAEAGSLVPDPPLLDLLTPHVPLLRELARAAHGCTPERAMHVSTLALVGATIGGEYEIVAPLGAGGGGVVYRARQVPLAREVALKVRQVLGLSDKARARFHREAAIAATLRHPHLVDVYQYGEDHALGVLFYAMRLVDGPTLACARSTPGPAPERRFVARCAELAEALGELHLAGLVHSDVKPENVVLEQRGAVECAVLVDFGLVREQASATETAVRGTWGYAPPEQLAGRAAEAGSDVFALGVTLCDLLSGATPREGETAAARVRTALARGVRPRSLAAIVAKATAEDPSRRYADGNWLAKDLRAFLSGSPITADHERRAGDRRRSAIIVTIGCMVIALLAGAGYLWVERARRAYADGDLPSYAAVTATMPTWLRTFATHPGDSAAFAEVLDVCRWANLDCALIRASGHLQRRGIPQEPALVRFLQWGLDCDPTNLPPLQVVSRMLIERPVHDAATAAVVLPLRKHLRTRLSVATTAAEGAAAIAGLAACGEAEDLNAMRALLAECTASDSPNRIEYARLVLRCMESLVARQRDARAWQTAPLSQPGPWLRDLARAVASLPDWNTKAHAQAAFEAVGVAILAAQRAAGVPLALVEVIATTRPTHLRARAVGGDHVLRQQLCEWDGTCESIAGFQHATTHVVAAEYGELAGLFADATLVRRTQHQLPLLASRRGVALSVSERGFAAGLAAASAILSGYSPGFDLDADTHLVEQAFFVPDPQPMPAVRNTDSLARDELASWDFGQGDTCIRGTAQVPIGDHVRLLSDGPEDSFLRLGLPAQSAVVLPFRAELVEGEPRLSIELNVQTGIRALLPNGGRVTLDILFDGAEQWRDTPVAIRGTPYTFVVNAHAAKIDRELVLRLGPSSTTTLRIFTVRVWRHP